MRDPSVMPAGVSKVRGVCKVDFTKVGANVKRSGINELDAKRSKRK
jgi:hypothetical protein